MLRVAVLAVLVVLVATLAAAAAAARAGAWVGSATCGTCHPSELAAWQKTAHARAADHLGARPRARCLACHGTGDAPAGKAAYLEVGCEACHGAGGHYAEDDIMRDPLLARALGLRDLSTETAALAVCTGCHLGSGTRLAAPALALTPEGVH
jgi:hypothetical protein